jgi:hypothetical protein
MKDSDNVIKNKAEEEEIQIEQEKIHALEQAFQKVAQSLQHLNPSSLNNMSVDQLVGMMEKLMTGNISTVHQDSHSAGDSRSHSRPMSGHHHHTEAEDKESIAREAARISTAYAEEQQKHDLMMKIQQARQRQVLQKKLWERNQARLQQQQQQQQGHFGLTPAGHTTSSSNHHDEEEEEDDDDDDDDKPANAGKIQIGYKSRLADMQPFRQPTIRGLANLPAIAEPRAPLTQQKSLQSRGLNLAPMMRR